MLGPTTVGVAHRTLPCGTRLEVYYGGRRVTLAVIDRGPYVTGVSWDLTAAAALAKAVRFPKPNVLIIAATNGSPAPA